MITGNFRHVTASYQQITGVYMEFIAKRVQGYRHSLTLARAGGCNPPLAFLEWPPNRGADRAEILLSLWGILCTTFGKNVLTGSGQVTGL